MDQNEQSCFACAHPKSSGTGPVDCRNGSCFSGLELAGDQPVKGSHGLCTIRTCSADGPGQEKLRHSESAVKETQE